MSGTNQVNVTNGHHHKLLKLRPILKSKQEKEAEKMLPFELPRKNCKQMSPALLNLQDVKNREVIKRWNILKKIMKRARVNQPKNVIKYLTNLDESDSINTGGEVSKKIYNNIFHSRNFNLYGTLKPNVKQPPRKHLELQALAEAAGIEYTQEKDDEYYERMRERESRKAKLLSSQIQEEEDEDEDNSDEELDEELNEEERNYLMMLKKQKKKEQPKLVTQSWRIGAEPLKNPAVGLSRAPAPLSHSLGLESFYSFDGSWKSGKMEGSGTYLFEDSSTYSGYFHQNKPNGHGEALYSEGQKYVGDWVDGMMEGKGEITTIEGFRYKGDFFRGKRHGKGRLEYPSGMIYEGEFFDGKPHGRGFMSSKLTGWAYEGSFENGYISGSGVIITPPPNSKRIVYFWSTETKGQVTLPTLIRNYLDQKEATRQEELRLKIELQSPLRARQLQDYVNEIREKNYKKNQEQKNLKNQEKIQKQMESLNKLKEERLRTLVPE